MSMADYLVGVVYFLLTVGAVAVAALTVLGKRYPHLRGAPFVLALATLVTFGIIAAHVVPLAFGGLSRGMALATAIVLAIAAWMLLPGSDVHAKPGFGPLPPSGRRSIWLAALGVAALVVYELARLRFLAPVPIVDLDMLNFHMPGIARWIQSGSLWQIDQLFPYFVTGNYPNSGDVVTLATVLPWRSAEFARLVPVPFMALTGVAVYALACELRAARATAALFATAAVTVPALSDYALEGLPDTIMLFAFVTGALFLVRHSRTRQTPELVMAGLALGVAFGTKWYGVTSVAAVLLVWTAVALVARRGARTVVRQGAALAGLVALTGGIWLLRNLIESGNPLYPQPISAFGVTLFDGPDDLILDDVGFTVAGYLGNPAVLGEYILPGLGRELGLVGPLALLGVGLATLLAIRGLRTGNSRPEIYVAWIGVGATALAIAFLYAITPGSAFGNENEPVQSFTTVRWLVPAPLLGAALMAAAATRLGMGRAVFELLAFVAILDGIRRGPDVSVSFAIQATAVAGAIALTAWLGYTYREELREWAGERRRLAAAGAGCAVIAVVAVALAGGLAIQERYEDNGYSRLDPTVAWIEEHAQSGHRIGLAGIWDPNGVSPVFPAFGARMKNEVTYIGPWVQDLLREYERAEPFVDALRRGRYELLLIGRGQPPQPPVDEEYWAHAAGFRRVAASPRLVLYAAPREATSLRGAR